MSLETHKKQNFRADEWPMHSWKAALIRNSIKWRWQANESSFLPIICWRRVHTPLYRPVLELVVWKHITLTWLVIPQSFNAAWTAPTWDSPLPDARTGSQCTCFLFVKSWRSLPSECMTKGTWGWNFNFCLADIATHSFGRWTWIELRLNARSPMSIPKPLDA